MSRRSDDEMTAIFRKLQWEDNRGPVRVMTVCEGYVMVRRPGAAPFLVTVREFKRDAREMQPVASRDGDRGEGA